MRFFRRRKDDYAEALTALARSVSVAANAARQDVGDHVFGGWDQISPTCRYHIFIEVLALYIHVVDRSLFARGGDELRASLGQALVDEIAGVISENDEVAFEELMAALGESGHQYSTAVEGAHSGSEFSEPGGHNVFADLPVIVQVFVDRVWERCGGLGRPHVGPELLAAIGRRYRTAGIGARANNAAQLWARRRPAGSA